MLKSKVEPLCSSAEQTVTHSKHEYPPQKAFPLPFYQQQRKGQSGKGRFNWPQRLTAKAAHHEEGQDQHQRQLGAGIQEAPAGFLGAFRRIGHQASPAFSKCFFSSARPSNPPSRPQTKQAISSTGAIHRGISFCTASM